VWVELVTKGIDMNEPASTYRRITQLMGNDDPDRVAKYRQQVSMVLFAHTPVTMHTTDQLLAAK
jgi:hypothetical protein